MFSATTHALFTKSCISRFFTIDAIIMNISGEGGSQQIFGMHKRKNLVTVELKISLVIFKYKYFYIIEYILFQ